MNQKDMRDSGSKGKFQKFDNLYQDACRRQERQEFIYGACVEAECTFQPDIDKTRFYNYKFMNMVY